MASARDRIILFPRYTTFAGDETYSTQAMNVSAYESGDISIWMGRLLGTGTVTARFEESTDGVVWSVCSGNSSSLLTPQTELQLTPDFKKAWMRLSMLVIVGAGDQPITTVYAYGTVNKRRT